MNAGYRDRLVGMIRDEVPGYDITRPEAWHMKMLWKPKAQVAALLLVLVRKQELVGESPRATQVSAETLQRYNGSPDRKAYASRVGDEAGGREGGSLPTINV